jgi:hypothetical protein
MAGSGMLHSRINFSLVCQSAKDRGVAGRRPLRRARGGARHSRMAMRNGSCAMCFMNHHPLDRRRQSARENRRRILRIRARCAFHCASLASRWYGMRIPAITELVRIYGGFRAPDCCFFTDGTKTLAEVRESSRTSVGKARAKADSPGKSAQKTQGNPSGSRQPAPKHWHRLDSQGGQAIAMVSEYTCVAAKRIWVHGGW